VSIEDKTTEKLCASFEKIIEALLTKDIDSADRLMKEQKKNTMKALQEYMLQLNTASPEILEEIWQKQAER
jgi:DNA-binding GntR family transcriptional regulator